MKPAAFLLQSMAGLQHARSERGQELARRVVVVSTLATKEISDWLEKLDISEYSERFAENRIDLSVLPDLTDQDLEKLGVVLT
jgi:hypothetical protein